MFIKNRTKNTKKACPAPFLDAPSLEKVVLKTIFALAKHPESFKRWKKELNSKDDSNYLVQRENELRKEIKKIDNALNNLYEDHYIKEAIPQEQFKRFSHKYQEQREGLVSDLEAVMSEIKSQKSRDDNIDCIKENTKTLKEDWNYLNDREKNMALKGVIKKIIIKKDRAILDLFYEQMEIPAKEIKRGVLYF
jgi:hypothetical protein